MKNKFVVHIFNACGTEYGLQKIIGIKSERLWYSLWTANGVYAKWCGTDSGHPLRSAIGIAQIDVK